MAIIDFEGLATGDRLRQCSDAARLWFPTLFAAANGLGRLLLDYRRCVGVLELESPPTKERFTKMLHEYRNNHLMFLYEAPRTHVPWGQWWAKDRTLLAYPTAADQRSPAPPKTEYEAWQQEYIAFKRQTAQETLGHLPVSGGPSAPQALPQAALVAAVLKGMRERFPTADEPLARQVTMAAVAVRPHMTPSEALVYVRVAYTRSQHSAGLYLRSVPAVLKTLETQEGQMRLFVPEEAPIGSGMSEEQIAALDRQRMRAAR